MTQANIEVLSMKSCIHILGASNEENPVRKEYRVVLKGAVYNTFDNLEAAKILCDKLNKTEWVSPFKQHAQMLRRADYGAARALQAATMSMWNGNAYPFSMSQIRNFDNQHMKIFCDLVQSYHLFGENDEEFMAICSQLVRAKEMSELLP